MLASNKQQKHSQRSMKDYASKGTKSTKRTISSISPTENKDQKKTKYSPINLPTSSTSNMDKDKEYSALKNEEPDRKLEGALGPLLQQIKLLRESFDNQYSRLDDKYTRLESAITSQKNEMSSELGKLHESVANRRKELTATVEKKMEQVLRENISLKKSNSVLQERLSKIEPTQLDNNVMLTGIQEQQWENFDISKQRVINVIAEALKSSEGDNALTGDQQVDIANCK